MKTILFLCTGNSCRSQMAEGFARRLAPAGVDIHSAGIVAHGLNPRAVEVMREAGIDISTQRSKTVEEIPIDGIDTVVTLCGHAAEHCPAFSRPVARVHWPIDDPAAVIGTDEEILAAFRRARDEILERVRNLLTPR